MKKIFILLSVSLLFAAEIKNPIPIPKSFAGEVQALSAEYTILALRKENLRLKICGEVGVKPSVCDVSWETGMVNDKQVEVK